MQRTAQYENFSCFQVELKVASDALMNCLAYSNSGGMISVVLVDM